MTEKREKWLSVISEGFKGRKEVQNVAFPLSIERVNHQEHYNRTTTEYSDEKKVSKIPTAPNIEKEISEGSGKDFRRILWSKPGLKLNAKIIGSFVGGVVAIAFAIKFGSVLLGGLGAAGIAYSIRLDLDFSKRFENFLHKMDSRRKQRMERNVRNNKHL